MKAFFMKIGIPELRPQDYDGIYFPFILMVISFSVIVLFSSIKNIIKKILATRMVSDQDSVYAFIHLEAQCTE